MDIQVRYNIIKNKSIALNSKIDTLYSTYKDNEIKHEQKRHELESIIKDNSIQSLSIDTFKEILDRLSQEHIQKVQELITHALRTIFYDENYSLEILMGDKRNAKTAEFYLVNDKNNTIFKTPFSDSIGGGILSIVGFVLQIYYIGYLGRSNIIFCDESFSQVSTRYIDSLIEFINELSEQKGFIIVLITHDTRLLGQSVTMYRVSNGTIKREDNNEHTQ